VPDDEFDLITGELRGIYVFAFALVAAGGPPEAPRRLLLSGVGVVLDDALGVECA
jgi:hypothetical protein